ncbi:MAG TPA: ATP-binding cassette domain-containing protein, partial [Spirochaetia bacterium]|nr:ATP-binding cassette domain-containing protein [Spirochaetia bacterium]
IYILDEFFEEIDPPSRMSILSYLKDRGKTVLILSAKLLEVYQDYMDKIFLLSEGKISENTEGRFPGQGRLSGRGRLSGQGRLSGPLLVRAENEGVAFRTPPDELIRSTEENTGLLLEVEDLSFRYSKHSDSGESPGFTLSVERFVLGRGETVSLVGRNGSGKSTLGKIISGLIVPEKGRIRIRTGSGLIDASPQLLNGTVAYMFQNPDLQIFLPTLRDELSFGLKRSGLSETDIESKVLRAIELFELPGPDMPPTLMSYGARKRLQAAVYHLLNRPLVILDEADSGLSYNNFFDILSLFSQQKCAVIAITHDIRLAKAISNRIILMKQGRFLSTIERSRFDGVEKLMEQEDAEL